VTDLERMLAEYDNAETIAKTQTVAEAYGIDTSKLEWWNKPLERNYQDRD
jgi:hypothetical protein